MEKLQVELRSAIPASPAAQTDPKVEDRKFGLRTLIVTSLTSVVVATVGAIPATVAVYRGHDAPGPTRSAPTETMAAGATSVPRAESERSSRSAADRDALREAIRVFDTCVELDKPKVCRDPANELRKACERSLLP